jgi:F-type H+-transporting ATPase subunit epsilon
MATLKVEIVSPESALWTGEASALIARSSEGEFTILPQHTPTVGDLVSGVVRVQSAAGDQAFAVHGGYFHVGPSDTEGETLATVLAGIAEPTNAIDVARAQKAKEAAEAIIQAENRDGGDTVALASARESLARAELRLSVATK